MNGTRDKPRDETRRIQRKEQNSVSSNQGQWLQSAKLRQGVQRCAACMCVLRVERKMTTCGELAGRTWRRFVLVVAHLRTYGRQITQQAHTDVLQHGGGGWMVCTVDWNVDETADERTNR